MDITQNFIKPTLGSKTKAESIAKRLYKANSQIEFFTFSYFISNNRNLYQAERDSEVKRQAIATSLFKQILVSSSKDKTIKMMRYARANAGYNIGDRTILPYQLNLQRTVRFVWS